MKEKLLKKIENKEIEVGVVGLGYVGLPLAVEKAKAGFKTIGFDVQSEKVDLVNKGHNYIGDVVDSDLKKLVEAGMLKATTNFSFVKEGAIMKKWILLQSVFLHHWTSISSRISAM